MPRARSSYRGSNRKAATADPLEENPEHRAFVARSLDRNDVDLSSLQQLNRTLHTSREAIIAACGEDVLLDLGEGRLKVINDELYQRRGDVTDGALERVPLHCLDEQQQQLCVDFLLRMTLRRRLNNRLARRLNRVANAIDGEDIAPPPIPKYGDKRIEIDRAAAQAHAQERMRLDQAKDRIQNFRTFKKLQAEINAQSKLTSDGLSVKAEETPSDQLQGKPDTTSSGAGRDPSALPTHLSMSWDSSIRLDMDFLKEYDDTHEKAVKDLSNLSAATYAILDGEDKGMEEAAQSVIRVGASHRTMGVHDREAEYDRWRTALLSRVPDQPAFQELAMGKPVHLLGERRKALIERKRRIKEDNRQETASDVEMKDATTTVLEEEAESNEEEKTNSVEKNESTDENEKSEDDREKDGMSEGVDNEKLAEDEVDGSRMDEDDIDADDNREEICDEKPATTKDPSSPKKDGEIQKEESNFNGGETPCKLEGENKDAKEGENEDAHIQKGHGNEVEDEDDEDEDDDEDDEDDDMDIEKPDASKQRTAGATKDEDGEPPIKISKRISLQPVPSFYEQDVKRIRLIHADMISNSVAVFARRRLAAMTNDYNGAFRISNQIFERRQQIQHQLAKLAHESHSQVERMKAQAVMARQQWQSNKLKHDIDQAKRCFPSTWGRQPSGTNVTSEYIQAGGALGIIGSCVADIVDGSIHIAEGSISLKRFEPFVPPHISPEALAQQRSQIEADLRRELEVLTGRLNACEEERKVSWRKLLKVKAELHIPHTASSGGRTEQFYLDANNINLVPLPPLRSSHTQDMPQNIHVPPMIPGFEGDRLTSEGYAKYSAARVRDRISADGSVAPVSLPKKTKDGLYQRPAGRTRKGMQWDAVRGIWVPDDSLR